MTKLISKPKSLQPGYGTILGTSLIKETMNVQKKGFSKKVLGLGVADSRSYDYIHPVSLFSSIQYMMQS